MSNYITVTDLYKNRDKYENIWISIPSLYTLSNNNYLKRTKKSYGDLETIKKKLGKHFSDCIKIYEEYGKEYLLDCVIKGIGYAMTSSNKNLESDILDVNYIYNQHPTHISIEDLVQIIKDVNPEHDLSDLNTFIIKKTLDLVEYMDLTEYYILEDKSEICNTYYFIYFDTLSIEKKDKTIDIEYIFNRIPFIYILNLREDLPNEKKEIFDKSLKKMMEKRFKEILEITSKEQQEQK